MHLVPGELHAVAHWCGGTVAYLGDATWIEIRTLEGTMRADMGDYVIRGVKGEFYPCKPDIFAATYQPAWDEIREADAREPARGMGASGGA